MTDASVDLEGRLIDSRLIRSKLHLILSFMPALPEGRPRASIEDVKFDDLIPDLVTRFHAGAFTLTDRRNLVEWGDFYRPTDPDG